MGEKPKLKIVPKVVDLPTDAKQDQDDIKAFIQSLLERAEKGELSSLIAIFETEEDNVEWDIAGCWNHFSAIGMLDFAKSYLLDDLIHY